jgi:diacylglycerol O-acyltransferase/trehalose O-mycolyltransferase
MSLLPLTRRRRFAGSSLALLGVGLGAGLGVAAPSSASPSSPPLPAAATWPACVERTTPITTGIREVGRTRTGRVVSLTLSSRAMQGEQRVDVLLPRRFDPSGRTRYPTLYLLHGAGGSYRNWIERDRVDDVLGDLGVIVVMPQGSDVDAAGRNRNGGYADWFGLEAGVPGPVPAWESYHVRELVPFVDRRFPTRADAAGRAVAGISMGGGGAVKYAAEYPGTFGYAGSFSGSLDPTVGIGRSKNCVRGDPATQEVVWRDNSPTALAANLRGVRLFVRSGDGMPGPYDSPTPPADPAERTRWQIRLLTEAGAHRMAQNFLAALQQAGIAGADARFSPGSHSQPYWQRDLVEFAGWLRGQLQRPPAPPRAFTVASAHRVFTAWGWSFAAHRAVREFAYLDVTGDRLTVTGSGGVDVVTPPRYVPGRRYRIQVDGAARWVAADRKGRLSFRLDLGPSHTRQQTDFGPDATRGWRTVTVRLTSRCPRGAV